MIFSCLNLCILFEFCFELFCDHTQNSRLTDHDEMQRKTSTAAQEISGLNGSNGSQNMDESKGRSASGRVPRSIQRGFLMFVIISSICVTLVGLFPESTLFRTISSYFLAAFFIMSGIGHFNVRLLLFRSPIPLLFYANISTDRFISSRN